MDASLTALGPERMSLMRSSGERMDIVAAFRSVDQHAKSSVGPDHIWRFSAKRAMIENAALSLCIGGDVLRAGVGLVDDGAFSFQSPAPGDDVSVAVRLDARLLATMARAAPTSARLWIRSSRSHFPLAWLDSSDIPNNFMTPERLEAILARMSRTPWDIEAVFPSAGKLHMLGWAAPPKGALQSLPSVMVDGQPAHVLSHAATNTSELYWPFTVERELGFYAVADNAVRDDFVRIELSFAEDRPNPEHRRFPVYRYLGKVDQLGLPPLDNIRRVSGQRANQVSYFNGGFSDFNRFKSLILEQSGRRSLAGLRVLDWGVGCGRLIRFFIEAGAQCTGIDIDADNIAWCGENFSNAKFYAVPLMPPTQLPGGEYDVIISSSVLSHLQKPAMEAWLGELARLLAPKGTAFLSFNGDGTSYLHGSRSIAALNALDTDGYFDEWRSADLDTVIDDKEYYRLTLMTDQYAQDAFARHFMVDAIVRSVTSGHQNVAVVRRR